MSEAMERAHETMHGHGHGGHEHGDPWARGTAVLISALAACLALSEIGGKSSQNAYLTHHIQVSDHWAFYQAKNLRSVVRDSEATLLDSLPGGAEDPKIADKIKTAKAYSARMRDEPNGEGMKQIADKAKHEEHLRDHAEHKYHLYEYASGALQISIVLASVSVVTSMRAFTVAAGVIGVGASLSALATALGWI